MRLIHILHHSISPFIGQYPDKNPIYYDSGLPMKFARAIKKVNPSWEFHCWRPERTATKIEAWESPDGLKHRIFPSYYGRYSIEYSPSLLHHLKQVARQKNTCFIVHGSYNLHSYLFAPLLQHSPTILQSHGGYPAQVMLRQSRHRFSRFLYLFLIPLEKQMLALYPHYYAISSEEYDYVRISFPSTKVSFSPTGLNFNLFSPNPQGIQKREDSRKMVLFVGRLSAEKGLPLLVEAFAQVSADFPNAFLVLIGMGPMQTQLERQIEQLKLQDKVEFIGHVSPETLPTWYRQATVTVMPSDLEWFGMVAAESMACGTPVIATNAGGARDIIREFECGYLVPPHHLEALTKALRDVLSSSNLPSPNISKGRNQFDWSVKVAKIMGSLEEQIENQQWK